MADELDDDELDEVDDLASDHTDERPLSSPPSSPANFRRISSRAASLLAAEDDGGRLEQRQTVEDHLEGEELGNGVRGEHVHQNDRRRLVLGGALQLVKLVVLAEEDQPVGEDQVAAQVGHHLPVQQLPVHRQLPRLRHLLHGGLQVVAEVLLDDVLNGQLPELLPPGEERVGVVGDEGVANLHNVRNLVVLELARVVDQVDEVGDEPPVVVEADAGPADDVHQIVAKGGANELIKGVHLEGGGVKGGVVAVDELITEGVKLARLHAGVVEEQVGDHHLVPGAEEVRHRLESLELAVQQPQEEAQLDVAALAVRGNLLLGDGRVDRLVPELPANVELVLRLVARQGGKLGEQVAHQNEGRVGVRLGVQLQEEDGVLHLAPQRVEEDDVPVVLGHLRHLLADHPLRHLDVLGEVPLDPLQQLHQEGARTANVDEENLAEVPGNLQLLQRSGELLQVVAVRLLGDHHRAGRRQLLGGAHLEEPGVNHRAVLSARLVQLLQVERFHFAGHPLDVLEDDA
ncbi:hypothetical protein TYRP_004195 [Tyrophagus putrescentiae]|nr:hypothetical protein TYRP_004195 [Tyrophagus putrescentiae]